MLLRFTKMHGLGNDFVMLDLITQKIRIDAKIIAGLSDRRFGVGFDQLLTVTPPNDPAHDFRYTIYNADGSEAEQCGNGARCFLRFVRDQGLTTKSFIKLETKNGTISCKLQKDGLITVDMGPPELQPAKIPFIADAPEVHYELEIKDENLEQTVCLSAVNIGNPHAVLTVSDVDTAPVEQLGRIIEQHPQFPERVNVGFMQIVSRNKIRLRVFERGVGETKACGTGACAAVVAGQLQGSLDNQVTVELRGGNLEIEWQGDDSNIQMTGPACRVYEGRLQI